MWQFIILGYVPGTDIQIGYDSVTRVLAITTVIYLTILLVKEKSFRKMQFQELVKQKAI